jgi:hypothetical protein
VDDIEQTDAFEPNASLTPPDSPQARKTVRQLPEILRMHVHHGDIIIQEGTELQVNYEVDP